MELAIWTIRVDGSDLRQVSGQKVAGARDPTWSPDGERMAYWAALDTTGTSQALRGDLAVLDLQTGLPERIIGQDLEYDVFDAAWSQDGKQIAFAYGSILTRSHLYLLDLEKLETLASQPTSGP